MPRAWYTWGGTTPNTAAGNYNKFNGVLPDCQGFGTVCAIYAYFVGNTPTAHPFSPLTSGIISYINDSSALTVDLPQDGRTYLYVKD